VALTAALAIGSVDAAEQNNRRDPTLGGVPKGTKELFRVWDFDAGPAGEPPAEFSARRVGARQSGAIWMVEEDPSAPSGRQILRQSAPCPEPTCLEVLFADRLVYEYPDVSVRLRLLPGPSAQGPAGAGLVFGARDDDHFYAAIVDVAAGTIEVGRVQGGTVSQLAHASFKPKTIVWHHLRVQRNTIISKEYIEVFFDGVLLVSFEDKTIEPGRIGLITRAGAQAAFDHLHAAPLYSQKPVSPPAAY
jgi:hypothetical protein